MARTPKYYHHGRSPAAWTGTAVGAVGFTIAAIAGILGPNWTLLIVGGAVIVFAALVTMVMKAMGYGQP